MSARPIKVFVHDIGPTFSFAKLDRAQARVAELLEEYGCVSLSDMIAWRSGDYTRIVYRFGRVPVKQEFVEGQWVDRELVLS